LEGRDYDIYSYKAGSECQTTTHWFVPATAPQDLWPKFNCRRTTVPSKSSAKSKSAKPDEVARLRALAHDLSNSLEAILQATYLLTQGRLDAPSKRWAELIDTSSQEAARINREMRKHLRALSEE